MENKDIKKVEFKCNDRCGKTIPYSYIGQYYGLCFSCAKKNFINSIKQFYHAKIVTAIGIAILTTFVMILAIVYADIKLSMYDLLKGTTTDRKIEIFPLLVLSLNFVFVFSFFYDKTFQEQFNSKSLQNLMVLFFILLSLLGLLINLILFFTLASIYIINFVRFIKEINIKSFKLDVYTRKILSLEGVKNKWGAKLIPYKNNAVKNFYFYKDEFKFQRKIKPIEHHEILVYTKDQAIKDIAEKANSLDLYEYCQEQALKDIKEKEKNKKDKSELSEDYNLDFKDTEKVSLKP